MPRLLLPLRSFYHRLAMPLVAAWTTDAWGKLTVIHSVTRLPLHLFISFQHVHLSRRVPLPSSLLCKFHIDVKVIERGHFTHPQR
ncbi:hypothetical protein EDC04DRAFT_2621610 [Pisolithus marmoratus]|nr:hypothetical protein EDC04DRAFT_2621610 [Pisolithus marmoratus]